MDVQCVRVTEVTYNKASRTAHPHFHVLVSNWTLGDAILQTWMDHYPKAVRSAQDLRKADMDSLKEAFKYVSKMTDTDTDPKALDAILTSVRKLHLVRPYGCRPDRFAGTEDDAFDELEHVHRAWKREGDTVLWVWMDGLNNWVDIDPRTGEMRDVLCDPVPT
jgi:hypothetical protein